MKEDALVLAFRQFYTQFFFFALSLTKNKEDAEDLVMDAYSKALLSFHSGSFPAWMYRVIRNTFLNQAKRKQREIDEGSFPLDFIPDTLNLLDGIIADERRRWLYKEIYRLKPLEQQIILLSIQAELSNQQIADITGESVANVKTIKHRVLNKLKEKCREVGL